MIKCVKCGTENEIIDAICVNCGEELPAPYDLTDDDDFMDDDIVNPLQNSALCSASLAGGAITVLAGAEIHLLGAVIPKGSLVIAGSEIGAVYDCTLEDEKTPGVGYIDCEGKIISPGFIDSHIHGMYGIDTNKANSAGFADFSMYACKHGLTTIVPTTVACMPFELEDVLSQLKSAKSIGLPGCKIAGLHMESNFINPKTKGAQPEKAIFEHNSDYGASIKEIIEQNQDLIKIVTLAPEMADNLNLIKWLTERGIIVSIGHSDATYEESTEGIDAGATRVTHLFNAMSGLHHRKPNMVGTALSDDRVMIELVGDGVHVHPAVMKTAINSKGIESTMVISDCLPCAYMPEGETIEFAGHIVRIEDGAARMPDGNIAGSIATADTILKNVIELGYELNEAIYMVSTAHAFNLGLNDTGQIAEGMKADLVILDDNLNVRATFIEGKLVYTAQITE